MSTHPIVAPKKLIEVALPLDAINKACSREKSIRHGHPSTLHLWWARRPLAAARAVLFAQLVNDPSWKYSDEDLKKNQVKGAITKKRNELFKLIAELVQWENTTNADVLERARREIRASCKETCEANKHHPNAKELYNPERLPAFHDPFAGGGAIPLEAQRLGLDAHASDLNPVAVLINKAMIEIPAKFAGCAPVGPLPSGERQTSARAVEDWSGAKGLAEDVRRYGAWLREEAVSRIGHLYPKVTVTQAMARQRPDIRGLVGDDLDVIAWIWARTVRSPNPAYAESEVPLVSTFVLASRAGKEAWVEAVATGTDYRFEVRLGGAPQAAEEGTVNRGGGTCILSKSAIPFSYIRNEAKAGRLGVRLLAIVAEANGSRIYLSPTKEHEVVGCPVVPRFNEDTDISHWPGRTNVVEYGMTRFGQLFTSRQRLMLTTLGDLVPTVISRCRADAVQAAMPDDGLGLDDGGTGARAYAEGVGTYLALGIDKAADYSSSLVVWSPSRDQAKTTFGRQALPMVWDFAEINPFAGAAGDLRVSLEGVCRALAAVASTRPGLASQRDAQTQDVSEGKVISTDPPYYDNIGYGGLSDFFYVWLRRSLRSVYPSLFSTIGVPKEEELIASPYRHGGKKEAEAFFLSGMSNALDNLAHRARTDFPVTVYYAFKQSDTTNDEGTSSTGWETFLEALLGAGFTLTGTWPMRTERDSRSIGIGSNALASSIILVCRPRTSDAPTIARKDFLRLLERSLPHALAEMTADPDAAVAPVDLAQAAIGPGMAIFSKYAGVLEADGEPMRVHNALIHINKSIDDFFAETEGDLDADTRFCIGWFQQRGFEPGPYGEADVLARAKGTAVNGLEDAGVLSAPKGKVRLLRVKEYPKKWDPKTDHRVPVWEACHQLCRALGESEHEAGALLARMPDKQDAVRQLAYYLYTICERQKWAEEARLYNELITSWPAIVDESHKVGHRGTQLDLLS
jgi:putative DNA methylase